MEEAGEVVQIGMKILRHGYESYNPFDQLKESNRSLLQKEIGDFRAAAWLMIGAGDVNADALTLAQADKLKRVKKYLHHQPK